ncbi:thymidylate synthase [Cellvibrio sp. PSBB006]|uniref:thymidylate synthase n=1 Tax=Cellvibrio sp. PSBB006 TaxID=1987723 RepID=UPI0012F972A5|nr:thymidylate synthase [Cellvibrio sp. PSBB006]
MNESKFWSEPTLDDLLKKVFEFFLNKSNDCFSINPSKGDAREIFGTLLELKNPRSRLSRTEIKGTPFSCLGELSWYLSGSDKLNHMQYYLPEYRKASDDNETVHGAYGPRLKRMHKKYDQLEEIVSFLRRKTDSRRAVIQIYDASDLFYNGNDVPCTTNIQFAVRNSKLYMLTSMRSNDVYLGLPHDIFCFTMIQEIIASRLNIELGTYQHSVGSLHLYGKHEQKAKKFIDEGWQSTTSTMNKMPSVDVTRDVKKFLDIEKGIREQGFEYLREAKFGKYWNDLVILLRAFSCSKYETDVEHLKKLKKELNERSYGIYIEKLIQQIARRD